MEQRSPEAPAIDLDARLTRDETFRFACGPHVPCFTECCGKLDLALTPYDVLRLRQRLSMSSEEFLDAHTIIRWRTPHGFPEVMLRMDPAAGKRCPFVTPEGCSVYEDRPGACRIYPLGRAATTDAPGKPAREFFFTVREAHCRGFEETKAWTVGEWVADQSFEEYAAFSDLLMELYVIKSRRGGMNLTQQHLQMFLMSCYDLEKFREFVVKSGFLKKFALRPALAANLKRDDLALLKFAFRWLKFAFFQEPTLTVKPGAMGKAKRRR